MNRTKPIVISTLIALVLVALCFPTNPHEANGIHADVLDGLSPIDYAEYMTIEDVATDTYNAVMIDDHTPIEDIKTIFEKNKPVIIKGKNDFLKNHDISLASSSEKDYSAIIVDAYGVVNQYTVSGYDEEVALKKLSKWQDEISSVKIQSESSGWSDIGIFKIDYSMGSRGDYCVTYDISSFEAANGVLYYAIHYSLNVAVNGDYRISEIFLENLSGNNGFKLYKSEPQSTSGTSTESISVSLNIGYNGGAEVGVGATKTWEYPIDDVVVTNSSNHAINKHKFTHDVNEKKNVGKGYNAQPGIIVSFDGTGGTIVDYHSISTCKMVKKLFGIYTAYENYMSMPFNSYLYINGPNSISTGAE